MTYEELIREYRSLIIGEAQKEAHAEIDKLNDHIDVIIEACGCEPYDWSHSSEGIEAYAERVLPEKAKELVLKKRQEIEEISEHARSVYDFIRKV